MQDIKAIKRVILENTSIFTDSNKNLIRIANPAILLTTDKPNQSNERLKVLEETNDGFKVAEADLQLRGPGELTGHDQSGLPNFLFGDLRSDLDLIRIARNLARKIEAGS
mgnify:CR=1 FL=1